MNFLKKALCVAMIITVMILFRSFTMIYPIRAVTFIGLVVVTYYFLENSK